MITSATITLETRITTTTTSGGECSGKSSLCGANNFKVCEESASFRRLLLVFARSLVPLKGTNKPDWMQLLLVCISAGGSKSPLALGPFDNCAPGATLHLLWINTREVNRFCRHSARRFLLPPRTDRSAGKSFRNRNKFCKRMPTHTRSTPARVRHYHHHPHSSSLGNPIFSADSIRTRAFCSSGGTRSSCCENRQHWSCSAIVGRVLKNLFQMIPYSFGDINKRMNGRI